MPLSHTGADFKFTGFHEMTKRVFMAAVAVAFVLLGMVLLVGLSSCSHSSDDFIGDDPDTRYYGISGGGENKPAPAPAAPAPVPVSPATAPVTPPAPPPKRYKPLIHIYWVNSSDQTYESSLRYGPGEYYTKSNGSLGTYPITLRQGQTTESSYFNVIIWAEDEDLPAGDPDKYTNVTSQCTLSCQWTLTPNASYTPASPLANGDADYVVMTGPDNEKRCDFRITLPPALPKGAETIHTWDDVNGWHDETVDCYPYAFGLAVDVELQSSTVLFNEPLPKQVSWSSRVTYLFRYVPGVEPYPNSGGSGSGGSGSGGTGGSGDPGSGGSGGTGGSGDPGSGGSGGTGGSGDPGSGTGSGGTGGNP